tara:strand:+ start:86 stop:298 length:213 start_codon:yes stop_codon:yes gene_type:complete
LSDRYRCLTNYGKFLIARYHGSYVVRLYQIEDYYVEVWLRIGLEQIQWIETINEERQLEVYLDRISLKIK